MNEWTNFGRFPSTQSNNLVWCGSFDFFFRDKPGSVRISFRSIWNFVSIDFKIYSINGETGSWNNKRRTRNHNVFFSCNQHAKCRIEKSFLNSRVQTIKWPTYLELTYVRDSLNDCDASALDIELFRRKIPYLRFSRFFSFVPFRIPVLV